MWVPLFPPKCVCLFFPSRGLPTCIPLFLCSLVPPTFFEAPIFVSGPLAPPPTPGVRRVRPRSTSGGPGSVEGHGGRAPQGPPRRPAPVLPEGAQGAKRAKRSVVASGGRGPGARAVGYGCNVGFLRGNVEVGVSIVVCSELPLGW